MADSSLYRVLDASLNRATEGLRVVEDYARFVLNDAHLSRLGKEIRHELASAAKMIDRENRLACRDTLGDVGTSISTEGEASRATAWDVCLASQERLQQALRSLEEFSKVVSPQTAGEFERLRYRAYTLGKALASLRRSDELLSNTRLYVLLDGRDTPEEFEQLATEIAGAGADAIQLRDKRLESRDLLDRARLLVRATRPHETLAIINDRADVTAAAGADGVHVGQDDLPLANARAIVGPSRLVGASTHDLPQLRQAVLDGADYVGLGPTFPSKTKSFEEYPGLNFLREASEESALPAYAIGGITSENLPDVLDAGATRVAVASAITESDDPVAEVRRLKSMLTAVASTPVGG